MKKFLDYASKKYYEGFPIMSDAAFDRLATEFNYSSVGYKISGDTIPHLNPLLSLQKIYEGDAESILPTPVCVTPKLDGAAISLLYIDGSLALALTRGDGQEGKDITNNIATMDSVPKTLSGVPNTLQIVGEIVAPKTIENARNYAAGALLLKSAEEFKQRDLLFVAYEVFPNVKSMWSAEMESLRSKGFNTVLDSDWSEFPHDGSVWRCDDYVTYKNLGVTAHHPKGAFALKSRQEGVISTLLDVVWQIGKSGVVSPVAILSPVNIGGAIVQRATLHNQRYIEDLDLEIGCQVEVIRSGEIIPRVVRRV